MLTNQIPTATDVAPLQSAHLILSQLQIRQREAQLQATLPKHRLMLQAVACAYGWINKHVLGQSEAHTPQAPHAAVTPKAALVLCGPGNNGGDGALIALGLLNADVDVFIARIAGTQPEPVDAQFAWQELNQQNLQSAQKPRTAVLTWVESPTQIPLHHYEKNGPNSFFIIDALLGVGQSAARPLPIAMSHWLEWANAQKTLKIAIDIPTGLDPQSGLVQRDQNGQSLAFCADHTLSLIALKAGFFLHDGPDFVGEVINFPLDQVSTRLTEDPSYVQLFTETRAKAVLKHLLPKNNSHKGSNGGVLVGGGSQGMVGAALLAGRMALHAGSGRVWLGLMDKAQGVDYTQPELMVRPLPKASRTLTTLPATALVIGPGLAENNASKKVLQRCLGDSLKRPLIFDAGALNLIANDKTKGNLRAQLVAYQGIKVLTPHPLEAARLLDCPIAHVQTHTIGAACELAQRFKAIVVLKGVGTVVADRFRATILSNPAPALATGGTGDVLAGLIAGLLARLNKQLSNPISDSLTQPSQNTELAFEAVCLAVHLHGRAGQLITEQLPIGFTASELVEIIRAQLNMQVLAVSNKTISRAI